MLVSPLYERGAPFYLEEKAESKQNIAQASQLHEEASEECEF